MTCLAERPRPAKQFSSKKVTSTLGLYLVRPDSSSFWSIDQRVNQLYYAWTIVPVLSLVSRNQDALPS